MVNLYPYKPGSNSARALADALRIKTIKHEGSKYRGNPNKVVINWGASQVSPEVLKSKVINKVEAVRVAGNKLTCLKALANKGVSVPPFTENREQAIKWLEEDKTVVVREVLNGHSGRGITILEKGLDFIEGLMYTVYVPKAAEYRVHVINNKIVDIQRKIKDPERDVLDWKVRSYDNGFIFVRATQDGRSYLEACEQDVKDQALKAVQAIGADFSAVDVVYNAKQKKAFVLELNMAPGLQGQTIEIYANELRKMIG